MTLYTLQVPNPDPGVDWITTVPGIRIYDVTGITALLDTTVGTFRSEFNGFNGFAQGLVGGADEYAYFDTNLSAGDIATIFAFAPNFATYANAVDAAGPRTYYHLHDSPPLQPNVVVDVSGNNHDGVYIPGAGPSNFIPGALTADDALQLGNGAPFNNPCGFLVPGAGAPMLGSFTVLYWRASTVAPIGFGTYYARDVANTPFLECDVLANGALQLSTNGLGVQAQSTAAIFPFDGTWHLCGFSYDAGTGVAELTLDGVAQAKTIDVAGPVGIPSTGRTPGLAITDGNYEVVLIGDGYPAQSTPGPYFYSWQPAQQSNSRATDGTTTTVGIPRLILPGGYTIGTRTPDLQPSDQWSEVVVWWNDDHEQAVAGYGRFDYGAGAHLKYHQIGAAP